MGIVFPVKSVSLRVEQSVSLVLECVVSGNPSPIVKWLKDGQELPFAPRPRLLHSNLMLNDIQISDGGNYTCFVQAEEGAVASANYTVDVLGECSHVESKTKVIFVPIMCSKLRSICLNINTAKPLTCCDGKEMH